MARVHAPHSRKAKSRPEAAFRSSREPSYFGAAEAASIADEAAFIADVAADEAEFIAEFAAAVESLIDGAGVTIVVVADGTGTGVVVFVVVSSFLLQAAKETAAARVTISRAVFMFLLDFGFGQ